MAQLSVLIILLSCTIGRLTVLDILLDIFGTGASPSSTWKGHTHTSISTGYKPTIVYSSNQIQL